MGTDVYSTKEYVRDNWFFSEYLEAGGNPYMAYGNRMLMLKYNYSDGEPDRGQLMRWKPEWADERELTVDEMRGLGMLGPESPVDWDRANERR